MDDRVYVHIVPGLPVREMVQPCLDGWSIQISADLTREAALDAYEHALRHIEGGDFLRDDADEIEKLNNARK